MSERDINYAPLTISCVRGLCDKLYDKRKTAGIEIEKMVKDFNDANNTNQLKKLIRVLGQDLMTSTNPNVKIGALMGLSSVAVGLGKDCVKHLPELMHPMLACLSETPRVRYQAVEALFNCVKIGRSAALQQFPAVFEALARLVADPEPQVAQAAELLDRLLKDVAAEAGPMVATQVVEQLRLRLLCRGAAQRQLLLSWLSVLDAAPDLDLALRLPDLLDGLLQMLDDASPEIRRMCEVQLNEFLRSIKRDPSRVDFRPMVNVLIVHAQAPEELLQLTAITWLKHFVEWSPADVIPLVSGLLLAILPCLAYDDALRHNIREAAATVNLQLSRLLSSAEYRAQVPVPATVLALLQLMEAGPEPSAIAAADWLLQLYAAAPDQMNEQCSRVFASASNAVLVGSDDLVRRALNILAEIFNADAPNDLESSDYYKQFLKQLFTMLTEDESLLEDRGAYIIRQLCFCVSAEAVYRSMCSCVSSLSKVNSLLHVLSTILLTAPELHPLRQQLKRFTQQSTWSLFESLYLCWCTSPVSLVALCLLTHNYQHCHQLITTFYISGDLEITVELLTEVDKLVQLIESPIFAFLRLELASEDASGASLRRCLFALLMLLPQGDAFTLLKRRLSAAPTHQWGEVSQSKEENSTHAHNIDFDKLLLHFKTVQKLTDK